MARQPLAANQADLGEHLTFIESAGNPNSQECLIIAHGGLARSTRPQDFWTSVNIRFGTAPGTSLALHVMGQVQVNQYTDMTLEEAENAELYYRAGTRCPNYSLKKFIGGHGSDYSYSDVRGLMQPAGWMPHVVSIRNRWNNKLVLLSDVVNQVLTHKPDIKTIYCASCRNAVGYIKTIITSLHSS